MPALPPGVLRTPPAHRFTLRRWEPGAALAPYVAWHWCATWDLRDAEPHEQATIPHPSAHLALEEGEAVLHGPPRGRFVRRLAGAGRVLAVRFRPGGARPLVRAPMASLLDRRLRLPGLEAALAAPDPEAGIARVEAALATMLPAEPDPAIALADRAVALAAQDRSIARVADLADRVGLGPRSLQRLFAEWVGPGPGWVIRRSRLQEAARVAGSGEAVDWARLAAELGYCDQAHLVRDFTATIGISPARYAAGGG